MCLQELNFACDGLYVLRASTDFTLLPSTMAVAAVCSSEVETDRDVSEALHVQRSSHLQRESLALSGAGGPEHHLPKGPNELPQRERQAQQQEVAGAGSPSASPEDEEAAAARAPYLRLKTVLSHGIRIDVAVAEYDLLDHLLFASSAPFLGHCYDSSHSRDFALWFGADDYAGFSVRSNRFRLCQLQLCSSCTLYWVFLLFVRIRARLRTVPYRPSNLSSNSSPPPMVQPRSVVALVRQLQGELQAAPAHHPAWRRGSYPLGHTIRGPLHCSRLRTWACLRFRELSFRCSLAT